MIPKRGEIFWVVLDPTVGSEVRKTRPCVVISADAINRARRTVVVVPLSSSSRTNPPITVPIRCMEKQVVAVCDQIRAIDKTRLRARIGAATPAEMEETAEGVRRVLWL